MNTKYIPLSLAALMLSISPAVLAEDSTLTGEELPAIDTTIAPFDAELETPVKTVVKKELTEDEQEEAQELQEKAVEIYNDILTYDTSSRAKSVEKNLEFLEKALVKAQSDLKKQITSYKSLNKDVYARKKQIDNMEASQELKDKRLIDLQEMYEQRKDSMTYSMSELKKRIITLKERLAAYSGEKNDLDIINKEKGAKKELTWAEKDKLRKEKALQTFDMIEDELINKEYDKYLK